MTPKDNWVEFCLQNMDYGLDVQLSYLGKDVFLLVTEKYAAHIFCSWMCNNFD